MPRRFYTAGKSRRVPTDIRLRAIQSVTHA
jgi:hypothetical protein